MLARLWMRAWLRPDSSRNRASFCSSMSLFSSSMVFRLLSMDEICTDRQIDMGGPAHVLPGTAGTLTVPHPTSQSK